MTFSVWDPSATITYILPTHTTNGVEQLNLYNGNLASLAINGSSNYVGSQNTGTDANQWTPATISNALGYVAPAPAQVVAMTTVPGGALREAFDYVADQTQMIVDSGFYGASVKVLAPDAIDGTDKAANPTGKSVSGQASCTSDEKGDARFSDD